jgi:hypothetical protein
LGKKSGHRIIGSSGHRKIADIAFIADIGGGNKGLSEICGSEWAENQSRFSPDSTQNEAKSNGFAKVLTLRKC